MMKTENLDTKILEILHAYFQQYPGEPKMMYNELIRNSGAEPDDVIQCLYGLREKKWTDFDLAEGAETGLVWLTQTGIRIAGDICRRPDNGMRTEKDTVPGKPQSLDKRALREAMTKFFNMDDLEVLCADIEQELHDDGIDLEVNLEMVSGNTKQMKILKLIDYLDRKEYLGYLVDAVRRERPGII